MRNASTRPGLIDRIGRIVDAFEAGRIAKRPERVGYAIFGKNLLFSEVGTSRTDEEYPDVQTCAADTLVKTSPGVSEGFG